MCFMCSAPFCREAASVDRDLGGEQLCPGVDLGTQVSEGDNPLSGEVRHSRVHRRPPEPGPKPGGLLIGVGERIMQTNADHVGVGLQRHSSHGDTQLPPLHAPEGTGACALTDRGATTSVSYTHLTLPTIYSV